MCVCVRACERARACEGVRGRARVGLGVGVGITFCLMVEPALPIAWVHLEHVVTIARKLRAIPRRVEPGEEVVVACALVLRMLDDRLARDVVEGELRADERHAAARVRMQRLHQVGRRALCAVRATAALVTERGQIALGAPCAGERSGRSRGGRVVPE